MDMIQIHLFEMALKGDRLDEINAEEVLNRHAAAQAKARERRLYVQCLSQRWRAWIRQSWQMRKIPSGMSVK